MNTLRKDLSKIFTLFIVAVLFVATFIAISQVLHPKNISQHDTVSVNDFIS